MIGFHFQGNSNDWPRAVALLPSGAPVKFIDGVQRCREAKAANPGIYTNVRHHVGEQNPTGDMNQQARNFFSSFVDDSFKNEAPFIDSISEFNEYFADSQGELERRRWIDWALACVDVWGNEYRTRPEYAHIELVLAETAVGNDIPWQLAKASHEHPWVLLGYHPYVPVYKSEIRPDAWLYYCGRWETMDNKFVSMGYKPRWFFGEFGAIGHNGPGWPNSLAANDGWIDDDVFNGNIEEYVSMMEWWIFRAKQTAAWKEGRVVGATIFTSGGGSRWDKFELKQPDMSVVALAVRDMMGNYTPPPPLPVRGEPRVQYRREYHCVPQDASMDRWLEICEQAYKTKSTVGFSYDDAGVGNLNDKNAVLYDIKPGEQGVFTGWFATHYPGTNLIFPKSPTLAYPVPKETRVTQRFGENYESYMRKFGIPGHNGLDFAVPIGCDVHAALGGKLKEEGYHPDGYGNYVIIDHGNGLETIYAHLSIVYDNDPEFWVGSVIGLSGNSGYSTGPHLHFGVRKDGKYVDPEDYL